jgi:hypothetical protein
MRIFLYVKAFYKSAGRLFAVTASCFYNIWQITYGEHFNPRHTSEASIYTMKFIFSSAENRL